MMDLFRAGTDTTATTLTWAIMYLAKYPDIQAQLQQEIHEVMSTTQAGQMISNLTIQTVGVLHTWMFTVFVLHN